VRALELGRDAASLIVEAITPYRAPTLAAVAVRADLFFLFVAI
jgi:hypothetical protein